MSREIFEKNLKAMEKWYPEFADRIRVVDEKRNEPEVTVEAELSWDDEIIFKVKADERSLYLNGKRNVKEPLRMWMEHLGDIHDYAPVVLLGGGSGAYLKKLVQNTSEKVNVILYEPSLDIFLEMIKQVDLSEEIESRPIAFVVEDVNKNELVPVIDKLISIETMEFLKQEIHPNYQELYPEKMRDVLAEIRKRTSFIIMNYRTGIKFSAHLVKNQMLNMEYLCDGYNTRRLSEAVPHDYPAILIAAGPSLDKNIQDLKLAKNKAFILAVDTAVKPLIRAGIRPDAFITIDAMKLSNLVQIDEIKDTPVIAPITANNDILKEQRNKKIFYFDGYFLGMQAYASVGKILADVSTGGSVACSGFSLLYKMGFNTIILVGQDLALTGNKSHADGTFQDKMPEQDTSRMRRVKGNYEDKVPTREDFKMYLDWFNMYVEGVKKHRDVRVINATAGGAYIENTEVMTLKEAIEENCGREMDFEECIRNMKSEFSKEQREKVVGYLHTVPEQLNGIAKNARGLYAIYRKIGNLCKSGHVDKEAYLNLLKKVKKQTKKCETVLEYGLVASTMAGAELVVRNESLQGLDSFEEEGKAISDQGMKFAKMMQECAELLRDFAKETLLKIE